MGVLAGRWLLVPRARELPGETRDRLVGHVARAGAVASILTLVGVGLMLARQLAEFRDPFVPLSEDLSLLLGSAWGTAWYAALAASGAALLGFGAAVAGRAGGWWVATGAVLSLSVFPGRVGHANAVEGPRLLALAADALHILGAGAWVGGLAVVLFLEWRSRSAHGAASVLPALVPAFSPVAMVSVGVLILTGTGAAWLHLPGVSALWTGSYGRLLLAKLALVAVVLGLGARNYRRLSPRLGSEEGDRALRRSATVELAVANLVLLVTALLVRTSPMGH